jgi:hypothetical protein
MRELPKRWGRVVMSCHTGGDTRGAEQNPHQQIKPMRRRARDCGGAPGRLLCCRRAKRERDGRNRVVGTRPPASLVLRAPEAGNANSERMLLLCVSRLPLYREHAPLALVVYMRLMEDGQNI